MHTPRLLIRTVMILVAVVAIEFTAIRAILGKALAFGIGLQALINTVPMGLALNFGLLRMFRTRGRARAFWVGFLVCGLIAMMSAAWAGLTPAGSVRSTTGGPNTIVHGSRMWFLWQSYFDFTVNCLEALGFDIRSFSPLSLDHPGIGYITIVGLIAFIPQLAIALVGGLIARSINSKDRHRPDPSSPERLTPLSERNL
jgi:hypothetical protein